MLTPALVYLAAGELVGLGPIALTLGAGLIAPAVLARALHPQIARIPQQVRRGLVNTSVLVICFGLGGELLDSVGSDELNSLTLAVVLAALVAPLGGRGGGRHLDRAARAQDRSPVRGGVQERGPGGRRGRLARRLRSRRCPA